MRDALIAFTWRVRDWLTNRVSQGWLLEQRRLATRNEFEGVVIQFPIDKIANEKGSR